MPGRRSILIGAGALALGALAAGREAARLAAAPSGDKDCGSILPQAGPMPSGPFDEDLRWRQRRGTVNDASCLDRTDVYGVVDVRDEEDVRRALAFARAGSLKVSLAGARHSMGGQAFAPGALVLDMRGLNGFRLEASALAMTVGSGATWHDIQERLHPRFAVKAMQSTDVLTVGGSIAVNAHGMDHRAGSIAGTIRSMRVMLTDGTVRKVSRAAEPEMFRLIVGGYGLFGIVLEAELDVVENVLYRPERRLLGYREFPRLFAEEIAPDSAIGLMLMYGHLSTAPESLLEEMLLDTYRQVGPASDDLPLLSEVSAIPARRLVFNAAKLGGPAMSAKWLAEKHIEPLLEGAAVSRNVPMHDSVR